MTNLFRLVLALAFMAFATNANAQSTTKICIPSGVGISCQDVGNGYPFPVSPTAYPAGATAITGNATGSTGAVVGTLAAAAAKTTYICGFDVSAIGGTAAVGPITIAGTITASLVYELASTATGNTLGRTFTPCIPASAVNTAITITTTADGTASAVAVNSFGYQK